MNEYTQDILREKIIKCSSIEIKDNLEFDIENCGIGGRIWRGAVMLAVFLKSQFFSKYGEINGKTVIELGAGSGVCGLVASTMGAQKIYLTDRDDGCVELMKKNYEHNAKQLRLSRTEVVKLDWMSQEDCAKLKDSFDVILGADILYSPSMVDDLISGLERLCAPGSYAILSIGKRGDEFEDFVKKIKQSGRWKLEFIPDEEIEEKFYNHYLMYLAKV